MQQKTAIIIVRAYAALALLAGLCILALTLSTNPQWVIDGLRAILQLVGAKYDFARVFFVLLGVFLLVLAAGLWLLQRWTRVAAFLISGLSCLVGGVLIVVCLAPDRCISPVLIQPFNVIRFVLGVLGVVVFGFTKDIAALFSPAQPKPLDTAPQPIKTQ